MRAQLEQLLRHVGVTVSDVELDIVVEVRSGSGSGSSWMSFGSF
jgi:hypothetical protein